VSITRRTYTLHTR